MKLPLMTALAYLAMATNATEDSSASSSGVRGGGANQDARRGSNYCTWGRDYECYRAGRPMCCNSNRGASCPYRRPPCDLVPPNPNCHRDDHSGGQGGCGPYNECPNNLCCSQWGYCGTSAEYCGECCQNGPCWSQEKVTFA